MSVYHQNRLVIKMDIISEITQEKTKYDEMSKSMNEQLELAKKMILEIPDLTISWNYGCVSQNIIMNDPIFYAKSVNKNWDEISFGGAGCCHESSDNPYYARAIKICYGQRVRGSVKVCIGRTDDNAEGIRPSRDKPWQDKSRETFGERSLSLIEDFFNKHPYKINEEEEEEEEEEQEEESHL